VSETMPTKSVSMVKLDNFPVFSTKTLKFWGRVICPTGNFRIMSYRNKSYQYLVTGLCPNKCGEKERNMSYHISFTGLCPTNI
jgi:hypothetical protein